MVLCFAGLGWTQSVWAQSVWAESVWAESAWAESAWAQSAWAEPGEGGIGIQLLDAPAGSTDPRAQRYIVDHVRPGASIQRHVLVVNKSDEQRHVEVYPGAATVVDELFRFADGRAGNELTPWISLDTPQLDLTPRGQARVTVTIQVPADASAGERYAVIWAAIASGPAPPTGIRQVHRVGVRVYLSVGEGGRPATDFAIGRFTAARDEHGRPSLAVAVTNTGGQALDLAGTVTLSDGPAGLRAGPFDVTAGTTLAPGQSGAVAARLPADLPAGPWTISVGLRSGTVTRSATARITFPVASRPDTESFLSTPVSLVLIPSAIGLLTITGLILMALRSRRAAARRGD